MDNTPTENKSFSYAKISNGSYSVDFGNLITISSKYTTTDVDNALKNKDISKLIEMSNYFYMTSGEYRRLVHSMSTIHTYRYVYMPMISSKSNGMGNGGVDDTYLSVTDYLRKYDVEGTNQMITFNVMLNGAFYGYEIESQDDMVIQPLPAAFCRTHNKLNGLNEIEFNFKFFDKITKVEEKQSMFDRMPQEFLQLYNEYRANKPTVDGRIYDLNWRPLDINHTRCHYLTHTKEPFFASVFNKILQLQEYEGINLQKEKMGIYRILVQNLPMGAKTGEPLVDETEANMMHKNAKAMIGNDGIDVLTTGSTVSSIDLSNKGENQNDIINQAENRLFASAGTSKMLYNAGESSIGLDKSIRNDESLLSALVSDYERHYNHRLLKIGKSTNNFIMRDLGITIYNESDKITQYKEQAMTSLMKLPYIVSTGLRQYESIAMVMFENDYLKLQDILIPLASSYTQSRDSAGAPKKADGEISDTQARQRDESTADIKARG